MTLRYEQNFMGRDQCNNFGSHLPFLCPGGNPKQAGGFSRRQFQGNIDDYENVSGTALCGWRFDGWRRNRFRNRLHQPPIVFFRGGGKRLKRLRDLSVKYLIVKVLRQSDICALRSVAFGSLFMFNRHL